MAHRDVCERNADSEGRGEPVANPARQASPPPPKSRREEGRAGWIVLWLLGVPIPILLGLYLIRGCT